MNDELLFDMVEECVAFAVEQLETSKPLNPFAMTIDTTRTIHSFNNQELEDDKSYEQLLERLRSEATKGDIEAVALLARVDIPDNYNPEVSQGLRIHLEERSKAHEKISARFLYIPYQLYKGSESDKIMVKLYNPIPVAFPCEIF